ncbi:retrovirus-related pol polyprotein from transposon TNT 1-94 [Tanacetum coccineum]|uniref:Retrovirus-related pol polyprotein from transposon TNT 1-94 n=1 Tax=Tanacetum coccineum TaxID=301880 RepID=A0ABQ5CPH4_9ASTR
MKGTLLTKQEKECKLYDAFGKFAHIKRESLHQYYLRFTQLMNDMNIYKMKLEQFQVNTKFLNSLPPEWSKFMTDVKLVRDLHTTNFDQLHAYLEQHELQANEVRIMRERNQDPLVLVANHQMTPSHFNTYQSSYINPHFQQHFSPSQSPQYGSIHPTQHYSTTYPSTPHGRQSSFAAGTFRTKANISRTSRNNSGQQRIVKCFNCQGEGHMERQCPKLKRKRDATWFRYKVLLVEAQGSAYQADDSDCDDFSIAKAVLMANLSSYGSYVLSEEKDVQFADFEKEINYLKQTLSEQSKEKELLIKTFNVFKNESKEKEAKNIDKEIALEKKVKELDNIVCKLDFSKRFVPQQELTDEQAFRLQTSHPNSDQSASSPVKIEAPRELSKVKSRLFENVPVCVDACVCV